MSTYFCLADPLLVLKTGKGELYVFMDQEHGQLLAGYWYRLAAYWYRRLVAGPPQEHDQLLAAYWYHRSGPGVRSCSTYDLEVFPW